MMENVPKKFTPFDKKKLMTYLHKGDILRKSPLWLRTSEFALTRCKPIKIAEETVYEVLEEGISVACLKFPDDFIHVEHENVEIVNGNVVVTSTLKIKFLRIKEITTADGCGSDNVPGYPHYVLKTGRFDIVPYSESEMNTSNNFN